MPAEQIKNPDNMNNLVALTEEHDQLAEQASELEHEIEILREKIKANREKKFLFTDKKREGEIEQEFKEYGEAIAWHEAELKKIWDKIHKIQTDSLAAKKI